MRAEEVIKRFNNTKMLARHGDVVIMRADDLELETDQDMHGVVAEGEVTGHAHRILSKAKVERVKGQVDQMVIKALGKTNLNHEEHGDGPLAKGQYVSGIQRQYNPAGWQKVVD